MRFKHDEFIKAMDNFQQMYEKENQISELLHLDVDWPGSNWIWSYYDLICTMCDIDTENDYNDLDYFVFELDFGKKYEPGDYMVDGKEIPLATIEDLWNALTDDHE